MSQVTYDRPMEAELQVVLENGETFLATHGDLEKFGYIDRLDTYSRFVRILERAYGRATGVDEDHLTFVDLDLTKSANAELANYIRYAAEVVMTFPGMGMEEIEEHLGEECVAGLTQAMVALRKGTSFIRELNDA